MRCPVDDVDLVMSERQGVEIDYCPRCRGVWLDRGELDKIIERSDREYTPEPRSRPSRDPGYVKPKRKKSFLSEIFEFGD